MFLASVAACNKTPAFPLSLIIQWIEVGWIETSHYWQWSYSDLTWWNLKLKTLKTMATPRKINAILLNIKINRPKLLVIMCRYKLATYWQNFIGNILNLSENIAKSFKGATFFDSHCTLLPLMRCFSTNDLVVRISYCTLSIHYWQTVHVASAIVKVKTCCFILFQHYYYYYYYY